MLQLFACLSCLCSNCVTYKCLAAPGLSLPLSLSPSVPCCGPVCRSLCCHGARKLALLSVCQPHPLLPGPGSPSLPLYCLPLEALGLALVLYVSCRPLLAPTFLPHPTQTTLEALRGTAISQTPRPSPPLCCRPSSSGLCNEVGPVSLLPLPRAPEASARLRLWAGVSTWCV